MVPVELRLENGKWETFHLKFDTGFNGELGLPNSMLKRLATEKEEKYVVRLADGKEKKRQGYIVEIRIDGERETRIALDLGAGGNLIGMTAVPCWEAHIEIRANGDVRIAPS